MATNSATSPTPTPIRQASEPQSPGASGSVSDVPSVSHKSMDIGTQVYTEPNGAPLDLTFLSPAQQPDELGRLAEFRVLKELGHGGMGAVFLADDSKLKRAVALKVMLPQVAKVAVNRERFLREAQAAAQLEHDNVVSVFQVSEANGVPFIAMPFLKGESLQARLQREGTLPVSEVIRIGQQIAEGLAAAHEQDLVHRDIKPGNIWLEDRNADRDRSRNRKISDERATDSTTQTDIPAAPAGSLTTSATSATNTRVKILDFGLARLGTSTEAQHLTTSGTILGTPSYMAPEQAKGSHDVDFRCDLFSLGAVLYRMATGRLPFSGDHIFAVITAMVSTTPAAPSDLNPDVPRELSDLIQQLLAKEPEARPANAREVAQRLAAFERSRHAPRDEPNAPSTPNSSPTSDQPTTSTARSAPHAEREGYDPATTVIVPVAHAARVRRLVLQIAAALAACVVLAGIILRIKHKDGTVTEIKVPDGAQVEIADDDSSRSGSRETSEKASAAPDRSLTTSATDLLDPAAIPAEERFPWQPKELVAVIGTHRQRHWGNAAVVAFSPDGKLLASGGFDGIIKVFAVPSMEPLGEVRVGVGTWVAALRFGRVPTSSEVSRLPLPDAAPAAPTAAAVAEVVRFRTAEKPAEARLYFGASNVGGVGYIDILPDVAELLRNSEPSRGATRPQTQASRLSYDPSRRFKLPASHPTFVALTSLPEQRTVPNLAAPGLLLVNEVNEKLRAWNILTAEPTLLWERPTHLHQSSNTTAITDDGQRLAYLSAANAVTVLDLTTVPPREVQTLTVEQALSVAFTPDGRQLAVGTQNARVVRWSVQGDEFTPLPTVEKFANAAYSLAITPDGQRLATAYVAARLWDISAEQPQPIADLPPFRDPSNCLALSPDGQHLALANSCGVVQCWDVSRQPPRELGNSGEHERGLQRPSSRCVFAFAAGADERRRMGTPARRADDDEKTGKSAHPTDYLDFVTFTQAGRHCVWRFDGKAPRFLESIPNSAFGTLSGTRLFTANDENSITIQDLTDRGVRAVKTLPTPDRHYYRASDDGVLVYLSGRDGHLHVLTTDTQQIKQWSGIPAFRALQPLSADGRRLALTTEADHGTLQFWNYDGERGQLVGQVKAVAGIVNLALSPDRQRLLAGGNVGLDLFDIGELPPKSLFQESGQGYYGVAFSPDGAHFAYCGQAGRLVIRETTTHKLLREWTLPGDLSLVLYAPDGRHLVTLERQRHRLHPPPPVAPSPKCPVAEIVRFRSVREPHPKSHDFGYHAREPQVSQTALAKRMSELHNEPALTRKDQP